ncbi:MAG: tRNA uridine-5-carboxymethylaminomethyl(34) synthesis GTPase MnmE [Candidatus Eremiobacteraeota bacterium]|nr:tRNA uridine-5-carboxymethylaminomethyl(34) synthesis GTPase MnmE [Candidatus Eremiobacteraeota bacterium]
MTDDTIAAVATPPGVAAIAIIRISGPHARAIEQTCFAPARIGQRRPATLVRGWIVDPASGERLDDALAAFFVAPHSYTGEDLVELHVHGGGGVVATCLALVLRLGAVLATPGEFTRRAFLNGRIDLAQAEAVADLIAAESERAAKAAAYRLAGALGARVRELRSEALDRLVEIEAHVDYPDEVAPPDPTQLRAVLERQSADVDELMRGAGAAHVLRDGIECTIAGPPNAGKSSLLNALACAERAIVSDIAGTTRDIVEDRIAIDGVVLRLRDTAGLRATRDPVEAEGVNRALAAIAQAQLVITVIDVSRALGPDERDALAHTIAAPSIVFGNKLDLGDGGLAGVRSIVAANDGDGGRPTIVAGSVRWPETIDELRRVIADIGWGGALDGSRALVAGARQIEALTRGRSAIGQALETLDAHLPIDLVAADLRDAIAAYGEVTGDTVTEEVLDGIFSRFCVGK